MKRDVVICREQDPVSECARLMFEYNVGLVPVIDAESRVVGVVTDRDLVMRIMADPLRNYATPVHRVMSRSPVTCSPEDNLAAVAKTMAESKKSRIIVVNQSGRCLGIVSLAEIGQVDPQRAGALVKAIARPEASISAQ